MAGDDQGAAVADSPPAGTDGATGSPAGALNAGGTPAQPTEKLTPFNQHPDWQRMVRDRNGATERAARAEQQLQSLSQEVERLKATASQPARTTEEREQRGQAIKVLKELFTEDPELKGVLEFMQQHAPGLMQGQRTVQQLQDSQHQALTRGAQSKIAELAKAEGLLPAGAREAEKARRYIEAIVADEIASQGPEAVARYRQGDVTIIEEAFAQVKSAFFAGLTRGATAGVLQTKAATTALPPRPAGGAPGPAGKSAHAPGSKGWIADLNARARAVIAGGV